MSESGSATQDRPCTFSGTDLRQSGLRGVADVAVVQTADFRKLHNLAFRGAFDGVPVTKPISASEMAL